MYYEKQSFGHWQVIFDRKGVIHIAGQCVPLPHSQKLPNDAPFSSGTSKHASSRLWLKTSRDSGLGELSFLQLSTTYLTAAAGRNVGYVSLKDSRLVVPDRFRRTQVFLIGTGAAGIIGAFLWWEIRSLEVRVAVGLSLVRALFSPMLCFPNRHRHVGLQPLVIPLTYFSLLPQPSSISKEDEEGDDVVTFHDIIYRVFSPSYGRHHR